MKHVLCLSAVLALVTTASASVRVFVTGSDGPMGLSTATFNGLTNAFVPTVATVYPNGDYSNAYDFYYHRLAAAPPIDAPSGTALAPVHIDDNFDGEFAYIWFQFQNEPANALVNRLQVEIVNEPSGAPAAGVFCYYKQDSRNSFTPPAAFRWDGTATPPGYPEWTNNPQTMVRGANSGAGIENLPANPPGGGAWNLYHWQADAVEIGPRTGVSLLGATALPAGRYSIHIREMIYASGSTPPLGPVGYFVVAVPEPASLLLLALAGLLLRRR